MTTSRETFNQIAESWYNIRHWPRLRRETEALAGRWQGGKLLNIGCAHGPDFLPFSQRDFELWGIDSSAGMLKWAQRYSHKFHFQANLVLADAAFLPFPDNCFKQAIAIASYHHIQGEENREKALSELKRVLVPGGEAFITVWNRGQPRFWFKSCDAKIPWRLKGKTLYRYYHLFSYNELKKLLTGTGLEIISLSPEQTYRFPVKNFSRNICALVRKPA